MRHAFKCLNRENASAALRAFFTQYQVKKRKDQYRYRCSFFAGQLWIADTLRGALWAVADGDGPDSVDGYRFIQM